LAQEAVGLDNTQYAIFPPHGRFEKYEAYEFFHYQSNKGQPIKKRMQYSVLSAPKGICAGKGYLCSERNIPGKKAARGSFEPGSPKQWSHPLTTRPPIPIPQPRTSKVAQRAGNGSKVGAYLRMTRRRVSAV